MRRLRGLSRGSWVSTAGSRARRRRRLARAGTATGRTLAWGSRPPRRPLRVCIHSTVCAQAACTRNSGGRVPCSSPHLGAAVDESAMRVLPVHALGQYVDKKCPFTGNVSIRGRILSGALMQLTIPRGSNPQQSCMTEPAWHAACTTLGVVKSTKMNRTIVVRRDYLHYIKKYARCVAHAWLIVTLCMEALAAGDKLGAALNADSDAAVSTDMVRFRAWQHGRECSSQAAAAAAATGVTTIAAATTGPAEGHRKRVCPCALVCASPTVSAFESDCNARGGTRYRHCNCTHSSWDLHGGNPSIKGWARCLGLHAQCGNPGMHPASKPWRADVR